MIKLDIISGFLGAGKTTFIKRILKAFENRNEKIVVIVNEFGDIGIDGDIIRQEGYDLYEISKGCLCCTLKGDFTKTLFKVARDVSPKRVILEPSGIFVVQEALEILKQEALLDKYYIDNLLTIVDSLNFSKSAERIGPFLEKQIESSTKLLLSKTQYIEKEEVNKLVNRLRRINNTADIFTHDWDQYINDDIISIIERGGIKHQLSNELYYSTEELTHDYSSYSFKTQRVFTLESVKKLLEDVKGEKYGHIIRSKGLLLGNPENIEFQYVQGDYSIKTFKEGLAEGKMVFIGNSIIKSNYLMKYYNTGGYEDVIV